MNRKNFYVIVALFCSLFITEINAQNDKAALTLLDNNTKIPIAGANFKYNKQFGISDENGKISFNLREKGNLELSHIQYGEWILTSEEIVQALKLGKIYREQITYNIQHVTVVALHPKSDEKTSMELDYQDKLSHDAGAVLNRFSSINSIRKGGNYGFDPVMRGFKYEQLNIVIDGAQCAIAACPNRMDPPTSQISPNIMQQVEIFKGPHSLRYGSALGGTINFVTASPKFSESMNTYGRLSGTTESNGGILRTEGLMGLSSKNFDFELLGSYSKGNDYKDGNGEKIPAKFNRLNVGANLGIKINDANKLRLSATHNYAGNIDFPSLPMDLISDNTTLLNLKHSIDFNASSLRSWNTSLFTSIVDHKMDNLLKELKPRMVNAKTDANTLSLGGRTEGNFLFTGSSLFIGADFKYETADGTRERTFLMGPMKGKTKKDNVWNGGEITKVGMFAEYHKFISDFKLVFSGRLDVNSANAKDVNLNFKENNKVIEKTDINPNISVGGLFNLNNNIAFGLWFGHASRSASLTERYINSFPVGLDPYDLLGNPNLQPEKNNQIDLTFSYKTASANLNLSLFSSFLKDNISSTIDTLLTPTLPSSPGVRRFVNIDDAFISGFEINWNQVIYKNVKHNFSVAYTYGKDNVLDQPLPEVAPLDLKYTLSSSFIDNKLYSKVSFRHVLKQDRVSEYYGEIETPAFSLVDIKLQYQYNSMVGLTFGVQNLLDEAYYEHLSRKIKIQQKMFFSPGRNVFLTLNINFM